LSFDVQDGEYNEEFVREAAVIAHARSRSLNEIATQLCVPPELLLRWKEYYAKKINVKYLPAEFVRNRRPVLFFLPVPDNKKVDKNHLRKCPECSSKVFFDSLKCFQVQQTQSADIYGQHSWAKTNGAFPVKIPVVDVVTERIERCPKCGLYTIRYVTERLANADI